VYEYMLVGSLESICLVSSSHKSDLLFGLAPSAMQYGTLVMELI
jgi:hypothetical protein